MTDFQWTVVMALVRVVLGLVNMHNQIFLRNKATMVNDVETLRDAVKREG